MKRHEAGFLNSEPSEQQAVWLEQCEAALEDGLRQQLEASALIGVQLVKIRTDELYRRSGYETFAAYCRKFLLMTQGQMNRFVAIAEIVGMIREANLQLPMSETQAVMLAKIPRTRVTHLWREVIAACLREETALSDGIVRRAVRLEISREKLVSPSENVAQNGAEKPHVGVKVTLDCEV